ncbi:MAG: hypothetical protein UDG88_01830 [Muribaculaceae bacterium]|nr:hypothetical protein [Muribaculaceae bacterium]
MNKLTLTEALFCDLVWLSALVFFYCRTYNTGHTKKTKGYFGLWLFIVLYSTFEFTGGDFFHYVEIYKQIIQIKQEVHLEEFYCWLAVNLPHNFYIWRFVIWGLAAFFWVLTLRNLKQDVYFSGLWFVLVVFFLFVGARQSLCFSVQYYALSLYFKHNRQKKIFSIVAVLILLVSLSLHKTAIVYILILGISFIPFGKRTLIVSVLIFPFVYKSFDYITENFIDQYSFYNEGNAAVMEQYMNGEGETLNILGIFKNIVNKAPIVILTIYSLNKVYSSKYVADKLSRVLLNSSYLLIYISFLFLGRDISKFIAPRFWDAAYFPLTLFWGKVLFENRKERIVKYSIVLFFASQMYNIAYTIYKI